MKHQIFRIGIAFVLSLKEQYNLMPLSRNYDLSMTMTSGHMTLDLSVVELARHSMPPQRATRFCYFFLFSDSLETI